MPRKNDVAVGHARALATVAQESTGKAQRPPALDQTSSSPTASLPATALAVSSCGKRYVRQRIKNVANAARPGRAVGAAAGVTGVLGVAGGFVIALVGSASRLERLRGHGTERNGARLEDWMLLRKECTWSSGWKDRRDDNNNNDAANAIIEYRRSFAVVDMLSSTCSWVHVGMYLVSQLVSYDAWSG